MYSVENGYTVVPLSLDAVESGFVVFRNKSLRKPKRQKETELLVLPDKWDIDFFNHRTGEHYTLNNSPLFDWTQSTDERIKYFSGTATYKAEFDIEKCSDILISFENIGVMATVFVNGEEAGTLWTKPYRLNISKSLKAGKNTLEIRVTNTWRNKIVDKLTNIDPNNKIFLLKYPESNGWTWLPEYGTWLEPSGIWRKVKITVLS